MPASKSMVGTVRGSLRCGRCHHARLRHTEHGAGPCAGTNYLLTPGADGRPSYRPQRCYCPNFTDDKD